MDLGTCSYQNAQPLSELVYQTPSWWAPNVLPTNTAPTRRNYGLTTRTIDFNLIHSHFLLIA
jgi:hypothetical protein